MIKNCEQCSAEFEITQNDLKFYDKVSPVFNGVKYSIPSPKMCPECRHQRRLSFRNERSLFNRKCDKTGKQMVSLISNDKPFLVYDKDEWWAEDWDAVSYGKEFNFTRSFFDQFKDLYNSVPRLALVQKQNEENSEYCNCASNNKNCYLMFTANYNEDCLYDTHTNDSKNSLDCYGLHKSENCYECIASYNCYNLLYSQECKSCSDSAFLRNCKNCKNCLFCTNLQNKEYYICNVFVGKEKFEKYYKKIYSQTRLSVYKKKYNEFLQTNIFPEFFGANNDNCVGNYLDNCHKVYYGFECKNVDGGKYVDCLTDAKEVMDYSYWGRNSELMYEVHAAGYNCMNLVFVNNCWDSNQNLYYCDSCHFSSNLFGCVGLKRKEYCIFNKQYTREEYEELVPKIIEHMKKTEEWGEFFPVTMSPFGYNETVAQEYFPLTKEEVLLRGWKWHEDEVSEQSYLGADTLIPDDIHDVDESICEQILKCEVTGKLYKIIPQELAFYKKMGIPIPRKCPDQRHKERMALRNPRKFWDRNCDKCSKEIKTSYAPERPEIVYCEDCYLREVY